MLLGQYKLSLDDDNELVLPEAFQELFEDGAYVTRGFEQNLLLMNEKEFQELYKRVAGLNLADPVARLLHRLILGNATKIEISASGRICLPEDLLSIAGLEKEIVLVGQGDYCEAWAPANWEKQTTILLDTAANSARFAQLDLAFC
jgi:MraZ protein